MRYFLEPFIGALFTLWLLAHAHAGEIACHDDGRYIHCWDSRTGVTVSTTERNAGGYSHTWDLNGHAYTEWDHNGSTTNWRTH